jgi:SAM-dependent methyltransferase
MKIWTEKPLLRSTDAYIPAFNTARYLEGKKKILIIGDCGGRDWQYLKRFGKELHVLDIAPQQNIPNLIIQSIETKTPYEDETFDGVVMNDVLEHLFNDVAALDEVYRIMKKDGVLVVTVPYIANIQDKAEFHVRVHTPNTIRRLLEKSGFKIEDHFCRGFCSRLPQFNLITRSCIYMTHKIVELVNRCTPDEAVAKVNGLLERIERCLGSHKVFIPFQKMFTSYGGVMKARKVETKKDFMAIQVDYFKKDNGK